MKEKWIIPLLAVAVSAIVLAAFLLVLALAKFIGLMLGTWAGVTTIIAICLTLAIATILGFTKFEPDDQVNNSKITDQ